MRRSPLFTAIHRALTIAELCEKVQVVRNLRGLDNVTEALTAGR